MTLDGPQHAPTGREPVQLILASRSPRRALLLEEAGITFVQADPPYDDPPHPTRDHPDAGLLAIETASAKALSLLDQPICRKHPQAAVLAADTIVVSPAGQLVGTPVDRDQARAMLRDMVDAVHDVVTGVALFRPSTGQLMSFADRATVTIGTVPADEIECYLDTGQWSDKAGGYNLFDRQSAGWPIRVTGDPTTVVGLPVRRVIRTLIDWKLLPDPAFRA